MVQGVLGHLKLSKARRLKVLQNFLKREFLKKRVGWQLLENV